MSRTKEMAGFTLVELIVVVALLAIFASIALPSFTSVMNRNKVEAGANELSSLLQYARSEAVNRGDSITVVLNSGTWMQGNIDVKNSAGTVLRHYDSNGFNLPNVTATTTVTTLTFRASGALSGGSLVFKLCYSGSSSTPGKQVSVAGSGQTTITSGVGC